MRRRSRTSSSLLLFCLITLCFNVVRGQFIFREDPLALLSGTLRTIQRAACDGEMLTLRCPLGTAVSIQLAQYGRPAPGISLCPSSSVDPSSNGHLNNDSCPLTPQMQHALLQTVVEACVKKRHCKFSTATPLLPSSSSSSSKDLAAASPTGASSSSTNCVHHAPKFVEVAYKCRPLEFRSKIICENETIQLKCKRNARIAIYSATFGRVLFQSLQCPQSSGVPDETCEASFSTETVMQVCHGKRRCTLSASSSTFGNPCSPQSHPYLRVVYTCVSRRILKDHYQGDLEDDESPDHQLSLDNEEMMNENSFESEDYAEPVSTSVTQLPPPRQSLAAGPNTIEDTASNDHPVNYRTTTYRSRNGGGVSETSIKRGGFFEDDNMLGGEEEEEDHRRNHHLADQPRPSLDPVEENNATSNVFGFITEWITSVSFVKENQEKFILYLTLSIAAGILVLLTLLIGRLWWQKRRIRSGGVNKSIHSSDPIPAFADDLSDVDNDIDLTNLSALPPPPPLLSELTSLNGVSQQGMKQQGPVPSSEGVRGYAAGTIRRIPVEEVDTHPRSFIRNTNSHYHYYG